MKISEMITEEMVRGIIPFFEGYKHTGIKDIISGRIHLQHIYAVEIAQLFEGITVTNKQKGFMTYDLARFLFVDAWDYFEKKGWGIDMDRVQISTEKPLKYNRFWYRDYPSRLHALASAVKFMWEQEGKTNDN